MATTHGPAYTPTLGVSSAAFTSSDASAAAVAVTDAPGTGKYIALHQLIVAAGSAALTFTFTEETSGTVLLKLFLLAGTSFQIPLVGKIKLATANKKLMVQTNQAGTCAVTALYVAEA